MIFANAEAENMTGEGYAWIVTEQAIMMMMMMTMMMMIMAMIIDHGDPEKHDGRLCCW